MGSINLNFRIICYKYYLIIPQRSMIDQQQIQQISQVQFPENQDLYKSARNNFIRKVYIIVASQLIFTAMMVSLPIYIPGVYDFMVNFNSVRILASLTSIAIMLVFAMCKSVSEKFPINMMLLGLFTASLAYTVSALCTFYDPLSILIAAGVAGFSTIGLTLYAFYSKQDFTSYWNGLNAIGWSFFMAVIFLSFINFIYSVPLISNLIALCFAVLYSAYILIDTQIILGRGKTKLNLDNYVLGAILLYIDIIGLFLEILKLIGNRRSD